MNKRFLVSIKSEQDLPNPSQIIASQYIFCGHLEKYPHDRFKSRNLFHGLIKGVNLLINSLGEGITYDKHEKIEP